MWRCKENTARENQSGQTELNKKKEEYRQN